MGLGGKQVSACISTTCARFARATVATVTMHNVCNREKTVCSSSIAASSLTQQREASVAPPRSHAGWDDGGSPPTSKVKLEFMVIACRLN